MPWFAQLKLVTFVPGIGRKQERCGASVIQPRFLLTAAHCFCFKRLNVRPGRQGTGGGDSGCKLQYGDDYLVPSYKYNVTALIGLNNEEAVDFQDPEVVQLRHLRYVDRVLVHKKFTGKGPYDIALLRCSALRIR